MNRLLPRSVLASTALTFTTSTVAAIGALFAFSFVPAWEWALLSAACVVLAVTAVERPEFFLVRDFRLPGVFFTALNVVILAPLPSIVERHEDRLPRLSIASIAAGVIAMSLVVLAQRRNPRERPRRTPSFPETALPIGLLVLGVLMFPVWLASLRSIPIIDLVTGRASGIDLAQSRQSALSEIDAPILRLMIGALRNTYLMFAAAFFTAAYALSERGTLTRRRYRWLLLVGAGTALLYGVVTTEKSILGQLAIACTVAALTALGRQLNVKSLAVLGAVALAFPAAFFTINSSSPVAALESIRRRLTFVPSDVMVEYFTHFPNRHEYLSGATVPKLPRLFGVEPFDLSGFVYQEVYGRFTDLQGNANASFLGVGWANFGFAGTVLWSMIAIASLLWLESRFRRLPTRTAAALRGVAVNLSFLLTSADSLRLTLNVAPGYLDLLVGTAVITAVYSRRQRPANGRSRAVNPPSTATNRLGVARSDAP